MDGRELVERLFLENRYWQEKAMQLQKEKGELEFLVAILKTRVQVCETNHLHWSDQSLPTASDALASVNGQHQSPPTQTFTQPGAFNPYDHVPVANVGFGAAPGLWTQTVRLAQNMPAAAQPFTFGHPTGDGTRGSIASVTSSGAVPSTTVSNSTPGSLASTIGSTVTQASRSFEELMQLLASRKLCAPLAAGGGRESTSATFNSTSATLDDSTSATLADSTSATLADSTSAALADSTSATLADSTSATFNSTSATLDAGGGRDSTPARRSSPNASAALSASNKSLPTGETIQPSLSANISANKARTSAASSSVTTTSSSVTTTASSVTTTAPISATTTASSSKHNKAKTSASSSVTTTAPSVTTTAPSSVTTTAPSSVTTTAPSSVTTTAPSSVTTTAPSVATTASSSVTTTAPSSKHSTGTSNSADNQITATMATTTNLFAAFTFSFGKTTQAMSPSPKLIRKAEGIATPMFGTATPSSSFGTMITTSGSFGTQTTTSGFLGTSSTTSSLFGTQATTSGLVGTQMTTSSCFGTPSTTSSVFRTKSSSLFGTQTTTSSLFGTQATTSGLVFTPTMKASGLVGTPNQDTTTSDKDSQDNSDTDSQDNVVSDTDSQDNVVSVTDSQDNVVNDTDSQDNVVSVTDTKDNVVSVTDTQDIRYSFNNAQGNRSNTDTQVNTVTLSTLESLPDVTSQDNLRQKHNGSFAKQCQVFELDILSKKWRKKGTAQIRVTGGCGSSPCDIIVHQLSKAPDRVLRHAVTTDCRPKRYTGGPGNMYTWFCRDGSSDREELIGARFDNDQDSQEFVATIHHLLQNKHEGMQDEAVGEEDKQMENVSETVVVDNSYGRVVTAKAERLPENTETSDNSKESDVLAGTSARASGADPNTSRADPNTSGADPNTSGADPNTSGADPNTSGADPNTSGADPNTSGADPNTSGADPNTSGADPNTSGADPNTSGADSNTTGTDPNTSGTYPNTSGTYSNANEADSDTTASDSNGANSKTTEAGSKANVRASGDDSEMNGGNSKTNATAPNGFEANAKVSEADSDANGDEATLNVGFCFSPSKFFSRGSETKANSSRKDGGKPWKCRHCETRNSSHKESCEACGSDHCNNNSKH